MEKIQIENFQIGFFEQSKCSYQRDFAPVRVPKLVQMSWGTKTDQDILIDLKNILISKADACCQNFQKYFNFHEIAFIIRKSAGNQIVYFYS